MLLNSISASGQTHLLAVYDDNQRQDLNQIQKSDVLELAASTAAVFKRKNLSLEGDQYTFDHSAMEKNLKLCPDQEFARQPSAADCSAVFVGEDQIFTAGHCIHHKTCKDTAFAFGYANRKAGLSPDSLPKEEVYFCKRVLARSNRDSLDFAVVQLDRPVMNHLPVKIAPHKVNVGEKVFLLSHPGGTPLKYSPPAAVVSSTQNHFTAGISALGGSSGAGVFLASTNELVGILVSGEDDYVYDPVKKCKRVHVCTHRDCEGEESTHVDAFFSNELTTQ